MQFTIRTAMAVLAFCASAAYANQPSTESEVSGGNSYGRAVKAISYSNVGHSGSYNKITSMDGGACSSEPKAYNGPLAPLDEEVSLHFRGPMKLNKVAAYTKNGGSSKREVNGGAHSRHRRHANFYDKREPADIVHTAGKGAVSGGTYNRVGYYDASSGSADGITFLGNYGGSGSGTFDSNYGSSLSYLNADGNGGTSSPTVLSNKLIGSNEEFAIYTDKECSGDECGYVRPGAVAYHGFDGADKIFMFDFSMPHDDSTGFNGDMPAIWMLNAQIPRTLQYGESTCSCWESGCGEFDIMEVLTPGEDRCKTTLHTNTPGGSSDYFERPTSGDMQVAVVMNSADGTINVVELPQGTDFSGSLSADQVNSFLTAYSGDEVSEFTVVA